MTPIKLPQEQMLEMKERLRRFYWQTRDEELSELAAGYLLDFMLRELGPFVYNQAVKDARTVLLEKMAGMEEDLFALEKRIEPASRK